MSGASKPGIPELPGGPQQPPAFRLGRTFLLGTLAATGTALIVILALSFAAPALKKIENAPPPSDWTRKMERIGVCLAYYSARNDGKFPEKLSELLKQGYLKDVKAFDASDMPGSIESVEDIDLGADFIYLLKGASIGEEPQAALRQNIPEGHTLSISKKGLSWDIGRTPPAQQGK